MSAPETRSLVVVAAGGPRQFVNAATYWLRDAVDYCVRWVGSFS